MAKAHGIMLHHFHDDYKHIKGQGSISRAEFRTMILWLKERYRILSAYEWYHKANAQQLKENEICITFDDNLLCQYEIALPVLEEFGIQAFWFVYTSPLMGIKEKLEVYRYFRFSEFDDVNHFYRQFHITIQLSNLRQEVANRLKDFQPKEYLKGFSFYTDEDRIFRFVRDQVLGQERYYKIMDAMIEQSNLDLQKIIELLWMNEEQIKYLHQTKHIVGLHSHTHPTNMKGLSFEQQTEQYSTNYKILKSILKEDIFAVSHPCNSYNEDTKKVMKNLNVHFGFRANMEDGFQSSLEYPRIDHALILKAMKQ